MGDRWLWALGGLVVGIVATVVVASLDLPPSGNLAEWAAAIGTVGALGLTYRLVRHEVEARRDDERHRRSEQARLVNAWVVESSQDHLEVVISNRSNEPIYQTRVVLLERSWREERIEVRGFKWPLITPGATVGPIRYPALPPEPAVDPNVWLHPPIEITFRDAAHVRWRRDPDGRLHLLELGPR